MLFAAIAEVAALTALRNGRGTRKFHAHHICQNEVQAAQVLCQLMAALIPAEFTRAALQVVIAQIEFIPTGQNIHNPIIFVLPLLRFRRPLQTARQLLFIQIGVCVSHRYMK